MEKHFDAAVIGSGSAGTAAATALRKAGKTVAVIDERPFGGTCALRGCDPKKVLVEAARALDRAERYAQLGIFAQKPALQWAPLVAFKRTFTDPVPRDRERMLTDAGIETFHAHTRFTGPQTLQCGADTLHAKHVVIATGAKELHVAKGDDSLLTSETFMELDELPESLVFVGGGYIAFEFAHVAARAGVKVTMLNDNAHPLHGFDDGMVGRLLEVTRRLGIDVRLETLVESVERNERGVVVHAKSKDGAQTFEAAQGVLAAGRVPDLDDLDLQAAGIERTKKGVRVNEHLQSAGNPNVYAAGDAADAGAIPLTPVAGYTGELAAENILKGNTRTVDFRGLATMVYTIPALGSAGMSEGQAREKKIEIDVHAGDMSEWYSTRHLAARDACYKLIAEKQTGKLLGATVLGPHAEEQINVLALAIRAELQASAIGSALFAYPTGSSDLEYMLNG